MLTALLTFFFVGLMGLIGLALLMAVVGMVFSVALGLAAFLLFKVGPILLIGWLILKLVQRTRRRTGLSAADRRWLDGPG